MTEIVLKRAYEPEAATDGYRILVDRLWPRGMSHETLHYDEWDKELAPSNDLREWYHEDPDKRWDGFVDRYKAELKANPEFEVLVRHIADMPKVTLLYASHDTEHNNAAVLRDEIVVSLANAPLAH